MKINMYIGDFTSNGQTYSYIFSNDVYFDIWLGNSNVDF